MRLVLLLLLLSGCQASLVETLRDPPRTESGRIDEDAVKDAIDLYINERCKFDTEDKEIVCHCQVRKWWCV